MILYENIENQENYEIRKIQALTGEHSFTLVLPKQFANRLNITKGTYLKCFTDGQKLIVEKLK